jgi:COMM domain
LCLASDSYTKFNEATLILELFLRKDDGKTLQRVVVEMNRVEAKAFVGKLREIERVRLTMILK